jgi:hypothetical protein
LERNTYFQNELYKSRIEFKNEIRNTKTRDIHNYKKEYKIIFPNNMLEVDILGNIYKVQI